MPGDGVDLKLTLVFRALSDETRQQIVWMLSEREMTAGEIASMFVITKPSVSHHLAVLRNSRIVITRRNRQHIVYSLNVGLIQECLARIAERLRRA